MNVAKALLILPLMLLPLAIPVTIIWVALHFVFKFW